MPTYEAFTQRYVDFHFTDAMGIVHFSNYYRFMEAGEVEFFRSLGCGSLADLLKDAGWIHIYSQCEYVQPLFYDDTVDIHLWVKEKTSRTLTFRLELKKKDAVVARGTTIIACIKIQRDLTCQGIMPAKCSNTVIPESIDRAIEVAPWEKDKDSSDNLQNVQIIRSVYSKFGHGDVAGVLAMLTDDVEFLIPGPNEIIPYVGTYRGKIEVANYFQKLVETMEFKHLETLDFIAQEETVIVLGYGDLRVRSSGLGFHNEWAHVFTLRSGQIARFREYYDSFTIANALRK